MRLVLDSMRLGYIHEIKAEGVRSADNYHLLHDFGYYTLNQLPDGEKMAITAENKVQQHTSYRKCLKPQRSQKLQLLQRPGQWRLAKRLTKQPADWTKGAEQTIVLTPVPNLKF